jgi:hypothetical protein
VFPWALIFLTVGGSFEVTLDEPNGSSWMASGRRKWSPAAHRIDQSGFYEGWDHLYGIISLTAIPSSTATLETSFLTEPERYFPQARDREPRSGAGEMAPESPAQRKKKQRPACTAPLEDELDERASSQTPAPA